ncbi:ABC transporter ATP-binding protein [Streptomyces sp. MAR4 CNX-425]|uniref:ABC transporter ATP-binding protein n=1 Tax=Streptomyces sp. MAR4 CNX-425 TaxID=3406343 RepID=UPI003B506E6F
MTVEAEVALRARNVHQAYGKHRVLRGADLTVRRGELAAVVGENGAGKSTLLTALAGIRPPDRGEVDVRGRLGYCPQEPVLSHSLTAAQHLRYFAAAYRLSGVDRGLELLRALNSERYLDTSVAEMSGGTRQKLNLALALLHDPDVLLLDEPYQGFDWETYLHFWDLVQDLRDRGKAIVVITHLVFEQERFDQLAELADGRIHPRTRTSEDARVHA